MAVSFTLSGAPRFPAGTVVSAYARSSFAGGPPAGGQAPGGNVVAATATVGTDAVGSATFTGLAPEAVYFAGAQVGGVWTWASFRTGSEGTGEGGATNAVLLTGDQSVAGVKTFSSSPLVPTPTADEQVARKDFVDAAAAAAAAGEAAAHGSAPAALATGRVSLASADRLIRSLTGAVATGSGPRAVAVTADSRHVLVANLGANTLSVYLRGSLGTLVLIQTIATGSEPRVVAVSSDGVNVYVANFGAATISQYERDLATGKLTALGSPTVASVAKVRGLVVSPDGKNVYACTEGTHEILKYEREASGALKALGSPIVTTQETLTHLIVSADGASVYVASSTVHEILGYKREADGGLVALSPLLTEAEGGLTKLAISEDGKSVYAACNSSGKVCQYTRNVSTGILTKIVATLVVPKVTFVAVSQDGKSVYATSETENAVYQFKRAEVAGVWTITAQSPASVAGETKTLAVAVLPDNTHVYAINETAKTISRYERVTRATVLTTAITTDAVVLPQADESVRGLLRIPKTDIVPTVSFTIECSDPTATGEVGWGLSEPAPATTYSRFTAANMPQSAWTPYSASSVFNQRLPASPEVHADSVAIVKLLLQNLSPQAQPGNLEVHRTYPVAANSDFEHPVYWAASTDDEYVIHVTVSYGKELEGVKIKMPSFAQPALGSDAHLCVIQPDGTEYDFYNAKIVGSTIEARSATRTSVAGAARAGSTAANFAQLAGIIRPEELISGRINHPLFCLSPKITNVTTFGHGATKEASGGVFVWPANSAGGGQSQAEEEAFAAKGEKAPPMGARLMLAMTLAELEAVANIKPWEVTLGRAMIEYGGYIGDRSGGGFGFQFLSERSYFAAGVTDPLVKWVEEQHALSESGISEETVDGVANSFVLKPALRIPWATKLRVIVPPATSVPI